jgi:hypothetical protein
MTRYLSTGGLMVVLALMGWAITRTTPTTAAPAPEEPAFHAVLKKIAAEYKSYGRVDDEARWGLADCRSPNPGMAHVSASKDAKTHGQKLYSLFVKDWLAYVAVEKPNAAPVGQTLVKQSWIPEELPASKGVPDLGEKTIRTRASGKSMPHNDNFWPYAVKGGKVYRATKQADLFIMVKLDPKTPGTDDGWVYGTVSPDGKKVTSAGRVQSCMRCHQEAKHDRQFGLRN